MSTHAAPLETSVPSSGTATFVRIELRRTFRNVYFLVFTVGFPLVIFFLAAGPNRHEKLSGIPYTVYFMTGMVAWGAMSGVVAAGGLIAAERAIGWNRQLRVTPLPVRTYLTAKVLTGYVLALTSMLLLFAAGALLGARLPLEGWLTIAGLVLIGLIPFAALGVFIGHRVSVDAMGPAMGGITAIMALLGGAWGPVATTGTAHQLAELLPSTWLVRAGQAGYTHGGWPAKGYIVIAVWSVVLSLLAMRAFERDTHRG